LTVHAIHHETQKSFLHHSGDVRLTTSKTLLLYDPNNRGIDQRDLLVVEGVKRREKCTEPECFSNETYDAWYVTARTAFWDPTCAQKWRDAGKPETWKCQWVPDEASRGTYIAVKRLPYVVTKYLNIRLTPEEEASIARVTCSP
jgi:hypothetical protein